MGNVYRHIKYDPQADLVDIASGVTVEMGDLMFLDSADDLRNDGNSSANYCAYPFEYFRLTGSSLTLNKAGVQDYFYGIAIDDVDGVGGVSRKISIASGGKWEVDLKPGKTVSPSNMFGAAGTTTASDLYNQKVLKTSETGFALGYFVEKKVHALKAEVVLRTAFGEGGKIL